MESNSKIIAIVSYITLIGWIIAMLMRNSSNDNSNFVVFHLRQSLGLALISVALSVVLGMIGLWTLSQLLSLGVLILAVIGILNANGGNTNPLPFVGKFFDEKLDFIK